MEINAQLATHTHSQLRILIQLQHNQAKKAPAEVSKGGSRLTTASGSSFQKARGAGNSESKPPERNAPGMISSKTTVYNCTIIRVSPLKT